MVKCWRRHVKEQDGVYHFKTSLGTKNTPVSKRLTAKTLSFISLMIAPSRGERMRPTNEQSSKTKIRKEARTFGRSASSATPKPSETMRPATPPEGPSVAAIWNFILAATGSRPRRRPSYQHLLLPLLSELPRRGPSSVHKHVPWHSCKRSCILISGMIVFERLVRKCETSTGRNSGHTCCSPVVHDRTAPSCDRQWKYPLARRSWQPSHSTPMGGTQMEIDGVYGDRARKAHARQGQGKQGQGQTKAQG